MSGISPIVPFTVIVTITIPGSVGVDVSVLFTRVSVCVNECGVIVHLFCPCVQNGISSSVTDGISSSVTDGAMVWFVGILTLFKSLPAAIKIVAATA